MISARTFRTPLLLLLSAVLLAGCGGGGGGNNGSAAVIGKVVVLQRDSSNNLVAAVVPGADISVDGGGPRATSLSQGTFRLEGISLGIHRIIASTKVNGTNYTGSTQALTFNNTPSSNANIVVSPDNQQATITGTVFDTFNRPLNQARVLLQVPVTSVPGDVASLVAFTDQNGNYRFQNVPARDPNGNPTSFAIAASLLHYQNTSSNVTNLQIGETRTLDFQLTASSNQGTNVPANVVAQSFTQPSAAPRPSLAGTHSPSTSVYEQIRRTLSPAYARLIIGRHAAAHTQKLTQGPTAHAFGPYAIEMDVFFDANPTNSLAGYRVYESTGNNSLSPYDFLQDPLANVYSDLDPMYIADQQYNFAVSAFNTDQTESQVSQTASVVPLGLLTLNQPQSGQSLNNPVTITWNPVHVSASETMQYAVFLYNEFPSINSTPLPQSSDPNNPLPGSATSYSLPSGLPGGHDYWVVVAAAANDGAEISVSQITKFHVP